jgi:ubiquinone/menaquinone biosynthesis C-methylase UbiE
MSGHDPGSSAWIWTEYWRGGRRGCLTDEAPPSAQAHIESLWRSFFQELPRRARVIDLACGSGEVARVAFTVSAEAHLEFCIEGVDLADGIGGTEESDSGTTLRLRGGIDLSCLPFPDNGFDCVVSQFGIEYANVSGACRELARVLQPAGRGQFLVHHSESAITSAARARLQAFASVIGDGVAFNRARQLYEGIAQRAGQSAIVARLSEFRSCIRKALAAHAAQCSWEMNLREILGFLADLGRHPQIYDPVDALSRIDAARDSITAWKARQQSQLAAAQDAAGMEALAATMRASDLRPGEIGQVNDPESGGVLAWRLDFAATQSR